MVRGRCRCAGGTRRLPATARSSRNRFRISALALAATALLAACGEQRAQLPSSPLLPYLQRKVGRIGFIGLDGNIRSVDQTGARNTPLTEDAGANRAARTAVAYSQPTWAPDGRSLAFARTAITAQRTLSSSIWVSGDEGQPREVYRSDLLRPIYLYWSPDSARLTLLSQPLGSADLELGVIEVGEDRYRRLDQGTALLLELATRQFGADHPRRRRRPLQRRGAPVPGAARSVARQVRLQHPAGRVSGAGGVSRRALHRLRGRRRQRLRPGCARVAGARRTTARRRSRIRLLRVRPARLSHRGHDERAPGTVRGRRTDHLRYPRGGRAGAAA